MKKILIFSLVLGVTLLAGGIVIAAGAEKTGDENSRYLVKSNNSILKIMYGVNHKFDSGFTTELSKGQLKFLDRLGVEIEEVQTSYILVKPECGDGICHSSEPLKCPQDCDDPEPDPEPCTPSVKYPWGVEKVDGGSGGAEVTIAVLDTGVYTDHPDLEVAICKDATLTGIANGCADTNGHGTHVTGTIAANSGTGSGIFGVAPDVTLMAIKVCGADGYCWNDDIAAGIEHAADNEANIISMSLGSDRQSLLIKEAINYAVGKGVLVIAAAGNDGRREGSIDYPAANINVIAVGAINVNENIPRWSSRGVNDGDWMIEEREIEFAAPGVGVESTWNNGCYNTISGTSMAAPHIAGIAARDWQGSASATRAHLQGLAKDYTNHIFDYGLTGDDIEAGLGLPIEVPTE